MTVEQYFDLKMSNLELLRRDEIIDLVWKLTELKCKETARNVRHLSCEILNELPIKTSYTQSLIMNIQDKDVISEL